MNDCTNLIAGLRNMDLNPCNKAADAIEDLQYRVAELEAKMAQREPVAFEYHGRFSFAHLHENERPLYAAPPVAAPVRLTHDAEDVLKQNILNEFARIGVIDGQPGWIQHYCHERKEVVKDPLTLDGELHCTILPAVEALKAERDSLQSRVAELESRLEISPLHNVDGIMARDATIKLQDERIAELEAERAEREKQEPLRGAFLNKDGGVTLCQSGKERGSFGFLSMLYAAPPVADLGKVTVAALCANGFKVEE